MRKGAKVSKIFAKLSLDAVLLAEEVACRMHGEPLHLLAHRNIELAPDTLGDRSVLLHDGLQFANQLPAGIDDWAPGISALPSHGHASEYWSAAQSPDWSAQNPYGPIIVRIECNRIIAL
jgi:hypothetical protein